MKQQSEETFSISQVSERTGVTENRIRDWHEKGFLPEIQQNSLLVKCQSGEGSSFTPPGIVYFCIASYKLHYALILLEPNFIAYRLSFAFSTATFKTNPCIWYSLIFVII